MEYSLKALNTSLSFPFLKQNDFINQLNLFGLEIDQITENIEQNDLKIFLKIPSNRKELYSQVIFFEELSEIFFTKFNFNWKKVKKNYFLILKKNYFNYSSVIFPKTTTNIEIETEKSHENSQNLIALYYFTLNNFNNPINSPFWIQKKLKTQGILPKNNIFDYFKLVELEWGQEFVFEISSDKLTIKFFRNSYNFLLSSFRFAFQRLLTLLEISSTINFKLKNFYFSTKDLSLELKPVKILKIRKRIFKDFLNTDDYDFSIFKKIGIKLICQTKKEFYFEVKSFRKDLEREIDLIEEYCRFFGYHNFIEIFPKKQRLYSNLNYQFCKEFFLSHGFNELIAPPLSLEKIESNTVFILNPLNKDFGQLRSTLTKKLIERFEANSSLGYEFCNYFEISRVFEKNQNQILEKEMVAGIFYVQRSNDEWFKSKALVEKFITFYFSEFYQKSSEKSKKEFSNFHSTKSIEFFTKENQFLGIFGEIHPRFRKIISSKYTIFLFELNLLYFQNKFLKRKIKNFKEYSKYPLISKDLSFGTSNNINILKFQEKISTNLLELKKIQFFDVFITKTNRINLGIHLKFQSLSKTLISQDIEEQINELVKILKIEFSLEKN